MLVFLLTATDDTAPAATGITSGRPLLLSRSWDLRHGAVYKIEHRQTYSFACQV